MERLNGEGVGEGARIGSQHGGCGDGGCEDEVMYIKLYDHRYLSF